MCLEAALRQPLPERSAITWEIPEEISRNAGRSPTNRVSGRSVNAHLGNAGQDRAKVVRHAKAVTFQLAEVAVPRALFEAILEQIGRLRAAPSPG